MYIPRSMSQPRKTSSLLHQVIARYDCYVYSSFYKPTTQSKFAFTPSNSALSGGGGGGEIRQVAGRGLQVIVSPIKKEVS